MVIKLVELMCFGLNESLGLTWMTKKKPKFLGSQGTLYIFKQTIITLKKEKKNTKNKKYLDIILKVQAKDDGVL